MIAFYNLKNRFSWRLIGSFFCTVAAALSFNNSWRAPRESFRYGGLQTMFLTTLASAFVALPVVLLQLAVGQLSQQDAVGIWRAVPFFKGVGFLRLLISFLCSTYSLLYLAISLTYFFYTLNNSVTSWDCAELSKVPGDIIADGKRLPVVVESLLLIWTSFTDRFIGTEPWERTAPVATFEASVVKMKSLVKSGYCSMGSLGADVELTFNTTTCLNGIFLAPVRDQPEYYVALAFIVIVLWILFPFIFYNPVKLMKRMLFVLGPAVILLATVILVCIGDKRKMSQFSKSSDWTNYVRPNIWHGALIQALISSQTAGGYLISSGDSIYGNTDVQWTSVIFVGVNMLASWAGVLFWFAIGSDMNKVTSNLAVLVEVYKLTAENTLSTLWPLICFAMLTLSGIITMLTFIYPLYDRCRRMGGYKWRHVSMGSSVAGAVGTLVLLAVGNSALVMIEDFIVPFLIAVATVLEISAFIFIYGWKILAEDIAFLTGRKLMKFWMLGWCAVPGIILSITLWWSGYWFIEMSYWTETSWKGATGIVVSACAVLVLFFTFAVISVVRQVQFDFIGKLKSSFRPSRHWGPRDPITHHYWLARREDGNQSALPSTDYRRQLGHFSGVTSFFNISRINAIKEDPSTENKRRSNSDDWLVVNRKKYIAQQIKDKYTNRKRSKSLDWGVLPRVNGYIKQKNETPSDSTPSVREVENNKIVLDVGRDLHV